MTCTDTKFAAKGPRKMARMPKPDNAEAKAGTAAARQAGLTMAQPQSKAALVLQMLQRTEGATLEQMVAATGWLAHTTRAALTGLRKKGHAVTSYKAEGQSRVYRIAAQ
jgi:hypothetical protein